MQALVPMFASSFGGAAASGAAGGLLGGKLGLLASAGSFLSSGMQMFGSIQSGRLQNTMYNLQAGQEDLRAKQIEINAEASANALRRKLLDDLSSTDAFFAGRGINIGSGSARAAQIESRRRAGEDLLGIRDQASYSAIGARSQANQLRAEGRSARQSGNMSAFEAIPGLLRSGGQLFGGLRSLLNG